MLTNSAIIRNIQDSHPWLAYVLEKRARAFKWHQDTLAGWLRPVMEGDVLTPHALDFLDAVEVNLVYALHGLQLVSNGEFARIVPVDDDKLLFAPPQPGTPTHVLAFNAENLVRDFAHLSPSVVVEDDSPTLVPC